MYVYFTSFKTKLNTYCHQIPAPMQKHLQQSWGKFPKLLHPPKLYEALRKTLCSPIPIGSSKFNAIIKNMKQRIIKLTIRNPIYLPTDWGGKSCIADITIQPPNITVHHCLLTFSWPKSEPTNTLSNVKQVFLHLYMLSTVYYIACQNVYYKK